MEYTWCPGTGFFQWKIRVTAPLEKESRLQQSLATYRFKKSLMLATFPHHFATTILLLLFFVLFLLFCLFLFVVFLI